ncbi:hypothetical protein SK128_007043, partial [Halocaridina rubra]
DLRTTARTDSSYTTLFEAITSGYPSNRCELSAAMLLCWTIRDSLFADGELVL